MLTCLCFPPHCRRQSARPPPSDSHAQTSAAGEAVEGASVAGEVTAAAEEVRAVGADLGILNRGKDTGMT